MQFLRKCGSQVYLLVKVLLWIIILLKETDTEGRGTHSALCAGGSSAMTDDVVSMPVFSYTRISSVNQQLLYGILLTDECKITLQRRKVK